MTAASDYGTYRLTYTPPNDPNAYYPLITIDMSTSGDANVEQMLRFYEAFLAASGYVLKGELQVVEHKDEEEFVPYNLYGFGTSSPYHSSGTDTISFGAAQPVEWGSYFANDVVSFG